VPAQKLTIHLGGKRCEALKPSIVHVPKHPSYAPHQLDVRDWESAGVKYILFPVKRSDDKLCLEPFIAFVDSQAAIGPSLFLVYSGKGLNRVNYCLAGDHGRTMAIGDAIGQIPLSLENYKGIKRVSRKELTTEDSDIVCGYLPDQPPRARMWGASSLDDLRTTKHCLSNMDNGTTHCVFLPE
jgi:hypothetical protein